LSKTLKLNLLRKISIKVKLSEPFELENFPFDIQTLKAFIFFDLTDNPQEKIKIVTENDENKFIRFSSTISSASEWKYNPPNYLINKITNDLIEQDQIILSFKVERNWKSYMFRIILIMALISLLSNSIFSLDAIDGLGDRLAFGVTILLTFVAYMLIVTDILPSLPYLTFIEVYIISIFSYISSILLIVALVPGISFLNDSYVFLLSSFSWFSIHLFFGLKLIYSVFPNEQEKLKEIGFDEEQTGLLDIKVKNN